ncbi:MAG: hypothetical protein FLDDKLPJ_03634 [Phycisphaerae bacterium]|nr:hypothetical protein [Phycisphaerae bacterium]
MEPLAITGEHPLFSADRGAWVAAGHLILDEHHFYQYDAWGRMVQANRKGTLTAASFASDGKLESGEESKIGALVGHYGYDGLGRVITRTWPTAVSSACEQTEHYYYDGVRRVQEQWLVETANCTTTPTTNWITKREYIHGPDYVDEFVAQVLHAACEGPGGGGSTSGHCSTDDSLPTYYLQDANYNVVATLDDGCPGGDCGSGGGGCGEQGAFCPEGPVGVYEQYTYEPYGQPSSVDKFVTTPPQNAVGHQGLIFDRYCGNSIEDPCITTTQKGLYHNRNRYYHARLGRFTTPDPNSSALPLIEGIAFHGLPPTALALVTSGALQQYSPTEQYSEGMSLYGYLSANPSNRLDPKGLFSLTETATSTAISTMAQALISSAISGVVRKVMGGDNAEVWGAMKAGFVGGLAGGFAGGFAGGLANSAFAASASGLFGTLAAHSGVGAVDGAVGAFAQSYYSSGDYGQAVADAMFGAAVGAATGGLVDWGGRAVRGISGALDDVFANPSLLRSFRSPAQATSLIQRAEAAGWDVDNLARGSHQGEGLRMMEVVNGKHTGRNIYWHPGGGEHGPSPYWKVTSPEGGIQRVFLDP